ncbi:MAG TPA: hypothetical protein VFD65_03155 [Chitinophagales bacterium]|nr:hypothetical protein [Chitinophagales bacterium]
MLSRSLLIFILFITSFSLAQSQSIDLVPKFDHRLTKYYKVDSCRVYENVNNGNQTVQFLRKLYIFNSEGLVSQEVEFGQNEYDGHTIIKYDYDSYHNITRKQILRPQREPIIYDYTNIGNKWVRMTVQYPIFKEYNIQTSDMGLVLGILVSSQAAVMDPITGEYTGKEAFMQTEEYEFRYNRFNKIAKVNYFYMNKEIHNIVYEYSNSGYGLPLNKSFFKYGEKVPEYTTTYTYDPTGFLHMETTKESATNFTSTLEYEYVYAWDSPILQQKPPTKKRQDFWIGRKKQPY